MARLKPELMRGSLDLLVLSALAAGPKYGYLVLKQLREASGGLVEAQAGTVYPLLHRLESEKLIRSRWDDTTGRRRKWYELTDKGRKRLSQQTREWHEYAECIRRILVPATEPSPKPT